MIGWGYKLTRDKQENHHKRRNVKTGIESESSGGSESRKQTRESDRQNGGPEKTGSNGETHSDFTVGQGEDLGTVGERHRPFTGGVESGEQEDEKRNQSKVRGVGLRNVETESSGQKSPSHLREGEEQERTTSEGVDSENGGPGENEVDQSETPRSEKRLLWRCTSLNEDCRRVESNDVDTTHLLGKHDSEGGKSRTADTGNGEQLDKALDVVASSDKGVLNLDLGVDVVQVACCLELTVS